MGVGLFMTLLLKGIQFRNWGFMISAVVDTNTMAAALLPGNWGSYVALGAVILFCFSCLISWYNYVEKAGESMFGPKCKPVLKVLWLVFILIGSYTTLGIVWDLADTANGLIIIPNLIGILLLSKEVVKIKDDFYSEELPKCEAEKAAKKAAK